MLKNSRKFFEAFDKNERSDLAVRLTINGQVYTNDDIFSLSYDSSSMSGEQLEIGSSYSNSVTITFCDAITTFKELDKVVVELGIKRKPLDYGPIGGDVSKLGYAPVGYAPLNAYTSAEMKKKFDVRGRKAKAGLMYINRWNAQEDFEYSRMGEFYISEQIDVNWNDKTTTLECSDALIFTESTYTTHLRYPAQLRDMVREAAEEVGLVLDYLNYDALPDLKLNKLADGELTTRKALEQLSQFIVGYVKINRFGYLEVKSFEESDYSIDPEYYFSKGLTKNDIRYKVSGINCTVDRDGTATELHSGSYTGIQMTIENKLMTQELLDMVYSKVSTIDYYPYSLSWRGNPALEVGDYITVSDLEGNLYRVPNISYSLDFNGSLKASSKADTVSMTDIVSSGNSPLLNHLARTVNEVRVENVSLNEKVEEVNESVIEINKAFEAADIQGVKDSLAQLSLATGAFVEDVEALDYRIDEYDIPGMQEMVEKLKSRINLIPAYAEVSLDQNGLFTREDFRIFLNHIQHLEDITTGTGWLTLDTAHEAVDDLPRFRKRNKQVELQFALRGFTTENQVAVLLPEDSRVQRTIFKTVTTINGKVAVFSINPDGTVKLEKVFNLIGTGEGVAAADVFRLDTEFPID